MENVIFEMYISVKIKINNSRNRLDFSLGFRLLFNYSE